MAVRAYLMSFLGVRYATSAEKFPQRYPGPWLVWEPSAWHAPVTPGSITLQPTAGPTPAGADALCFELDLPVGAELLLGRDPECGLLINDATFSRRALLLRCDAPGGYAVALAEEGKPTLVAGAPLTTSARPLSSGAELKAGDVTMHFYVGDAFLARLAAETAGIKR